MVAECQWWAKVNGRRRHWALDRGAPYAALPMYVVVKCSWLSNVHVRQSLMVVRGSCSPKVHGRPSLIVDKSSCLVKICGRQILMVVKGT